jgi:hypothetical protein
MEKAGQTLSEVTPGRLGKNTLFRREHYRFVNRNPHYESGASGSRSFEGDCREGALFSRLIRGGSPSPELVEGNGEGASVPRG